MVEAGHDPRRFATDLLDRLRDLIVLDAVPEAGGNGLLDCPPDRLDLMSSQAKALGSATLSRMADTVHEGLTEMRGTTAPRLLLELVCARMLLPATDGSAAATLQRLERLERRMSIAGEHAGRPAGGGARREPAPPGDRPREPRPGAGTRQRGPPPLSGRRARAGTRGAGCAAARPAYVRPSRATAAERPAPHAGEPGAGCRERRRLARDRSAGFGCGPHGDCRLARPAAGRAHAVRGGPGPSARPARQASGEPDIPLPPEPTDDEDWPHPAEPAAARAAAARTDQVGDRAAASASPPRAAAESAPAPRGGEPTPLVSADPAGGRRRADHDRRPPGLAGAARGGQAAQAHHRGAAEERAGAPAGERRAHAVDAVPGAGPQAGRRPEQGRHPRGAQRAARRPLAGGRRRRGRRRAGGRHPWRPEAAREAAARPRGREASELMAERAAEAADPDRADEPVVDPEQAALSLLRTQLGAHPVDS